MFNKEGMGYYGQMKLNTKLILLGALLTALTPIFVTHAFAATVNFPTKQLVQAYMQRPTMEYIQIPVAEKPSSIQSATSGNYFYVTYEDKGNVYLVTSADGGNTFGTPTQLSNTGLTESPVIAATADGKVFVLWQDNSGKQSSIWASTSFDHANTFKTYDISNTPNSATDPKFIGTGSDGLPYPFWNEESTTPGTAPHIELVGHCCW
jgi:hypothetical protein